MSEPINIGVYYYYGTKIYNLSQMTTQVTWSGDIAEASRTCEIALVNTLDGSNPYLKLEEGRTIHCSKNGTIFFRGTIFSTTINSKGEMTLTCRDANHYLTKNTDTLKFTNQTASQVITSICKQYGIPYGKIADTKYKIPRLLYRNKSLYDMCVIALTETRKKTGGKFIVTNDADGKLNLTERKNQVVRLIISEGNNLITSSLTQSIEDMRNSIRITGKDGEDSKGITVSGSTSIQNYGLMRQKEHEADKTNAELKPIANALLAELNVKKKEMTVEGVGDTSIRSGVSVQISDRMTNIQGGFYVQSDSHTFVPNLSHTMSIQVSYTLDLPELEYEEPPKDEPTETASGGGTGSSSGEKATGKALDVVSVAQSFVGKLRYAFGGTNIAGGSGDCSAFTQYCFRQVGVSLGRDTLSQIKQGEQVNKSEARPGDVVFFKGTYRSGVSHVGIVTSPGRCISLASSGCKDHSYTSGYWGNHYMQIRRVT